MSSEWDDMLKEMKKDQEEQTGGNRKYWQPPRDKDGSFPIRILPPLKKKGETKFYFAHRNHWIDGTPFECLNQTLTDKSGNLHEAETCPACTLTKKLYKAADNNRSSDEWKAAGEISAKQRYVYRVVVRGKDDPAQPEFYETGKTIFNILVHIMTETEYGIIVDPKNGRDFIIEKKGTGRRTKYDQSLPAPTTTPLFSDIESVKKCLVNASNMEFNTLIEFASSESLKKAIRDHLGGGSSEKKSSEDKPKTSTKTEAKAKPVEEEADDNSDDELDSILDEFEDVDV